MRRMTIVLALLLLAVVASSAGADWLFNKDACQSFVTPQDNFEICLPGDYTKTADITNRVTPPGWVFAAKSYDATRNETCFSFTGPALPQQPATATPYHFGLAFKDYVGGEIKEKSEYWTSRTVASPLPGGSCNFRYDATTQTMTVVVSNDTDAATSVSQVGIRVFPTMQQLETLNASEMPPSSFEPSGIPDGTILGPGEQRSFTVRSVALSDWAVCFQDVQFANAPPQPPCSGHVRLWTQASVNQAPPSTGTASNSTASPAGTKVRTARRRAR
jgi:hypothetical protein